jgi:rhomboid protease GluP
LETLEERIVVHAAQQANTGQRTRVRFVPNARSTYVVYFLIAINVAIFLARLISPEFNYQSMIWGANSGTLVWTTGEYWRLLTSMFLHASIYATRAGGFALENSLHVLFNMFMLYTAGSLMERYFGHTRFLLIYLLGGLTASLTSAALGIENSVGASGAVAAILAAEFGFYYRHRELMGDQGRRLRSSLIQLAFFNLLFGIASWFGTTLRVDNWAHLGGMAAGLALAALTGARYVVMQPEPDAEMMTARDRSDPQASLMRLGWYSLALAAFGIIFTLINRA